MRIRLTTVFVAMSAALLLTGFALPAGAVEEFNVSDDGIAIHGYDPVAYHRSQAPIEGSRAYRATHDGSTYFFASAENRDTFIADPGAFAPAYGGWCSYGVRVGRKFDIDPAAFQIVDGQLYLQLDLGTQKVWAEDLERNIAVADRIWPGIRSIPADQLGE